MTVFVQLKICLPMKLLQMMLQTSFLLSLTHPASYQYHHYNNYHSLQAIITSLLSATFSPPQKYHHHHLISTTTTIIIIIITMITPIKMIIITTKTIIIISSRLGSAFPHCYIRRFLKATHTVAFVSTTTFHSMTSVAAMF